MKWSNVRLIFRRELRDQLRDRRTLFTIAVLPLLLYPLLGMIFLQITQFKREHPTHVLIVGAEALPESPALIDDESFVADFCTPSESRLLKLDFAATDGSLSESKSYSFDTSHGSLDQLHELAQTRIESGEYDLVLYFPADFAEKLTRYRQGLRESGKHSEQRQGSTVKVPAPQVLVNAASDRSRIAMQRVNAVLGRWRE